MFWDIYLIIGLIIFTYLLYRTITNMIRHSKGLLVKKYRFIYSFLNDDPGEFGIILFVSILLAAFWIIHWPLLFIYMCWTLIIIPLLTRLTLSKEERVQIAIGATPNKKEE